MLLDQNMLDEFDKRLKQRYPNFNINIFLLMIEVTARYTGFPSKKLPKKYYLDFVVKAMGDESVIKNANERARCLGSMYLVMVCFCYLQETLGLEAIDESLEVLLNEAIGSRLATTEEEVADEKYLLFLLIKDPREILQLIVTHFESLQKERMPVFLERRVFEKKNYYQHNKFGDNVFHEEVFKSTLLSINALKEPTSRETYLKIVSTFLQDQYLKSTSHEKTQSSPLINIVQADSAGSFEQRESINSTTSLDTNERVNIMACRDVNKSSNNSFFSNYREKTDGVPDNLLHRIFSGSIK